MLRSWLQGSVLLHEGCMSGSGPSIAISSEVDDVPGGMLRLFNGGP